VSSTTLSLSNVFTINFSLLKDSFALVLYKSIVLDVTIVHVQESFTKAKPKINFNEILI
jgi:hypothetical protein